MVPASFSPDYGGANFVSALIRQGLIDEFHLLINPTLMDNGMTIFKDIEDKQNLILVNPHHLIAGLLFLIMN